MALILVVTLTVISFGMVISWFTPRKGKKSAPDKENPQELSGEKLLKLITELMGKKEAPPAKSNSTAIIWAFLLGVLLAYMLFFYLDRETSEVAPEDAATIEYLDAFKNS